jgi:hypothetical protein
MTSPSTEIPGKYAYNIMYDFPGGLIGFSEQPNCGRKIK